MLLKKELQAVLRRVKQLYPHAITEVREDSIPAELKAHRQWLLWRFELRNGKWTKPPFRIDDRRASHSNPDDWCSYTEAMECYRRGRAHGIGYVLVKAQGLVAIDLDRCIHSKKQTLFTWAKKILRHLDSYSELSPSGSGVHCIVRGVLPAEHRKRERLEFYDNRRYLCVTGHQISGFPGEIRDRPEALNRLHDVAFPRKPTEDFPLYEKFNPELALSDEELIAKAKSAKNGEKFMLLWQGRDREYIKRYRPRDASASGLDMALCNQLRFWCNGDLQAIDRLFRKSKRFRPKKWDRKHASDGRTYGQITLERTLALWR